MKYKALEDALFKVLSYPAGKILVGLPLLTAGAMVLLAAVHIEDCIIKHRDKWSSRKK